ncbi:hypothetical protein BKA69DRAFT_875113 [Paraphysoderma sedebokerense]|nr:hypothetical protein BKA69DRAFT_875113 [Paraphysoderma sedebokerense]
MRVHNLPSFLLSCSPRYRPFNTPINKLPYSALNKRLTVHPVRCFTSTLFNRNSTPPSTGAVNDNEINSKVDQKGFPTLSISNVPTTPKLLGFAGLIPFIGSTICAYTSVGPDVIQWQLVQGAYGSYALLFVPQIQRFLLFFWNLFIPAMLIQWND